jgi:hypothetical protein
MEHFGDHIKTFLARNFIFIKIFGRKKNSILENKQDMSKASLKKFKINKKFDESWRRNM